MVTSELQKAYNLNNPKGGYSYYTLYRGESTDTKPSYAQTGDVFEEYGTGKVYTCERKKGKAVWTEDPNAKRQTETGGGGGSLPADFPVEGSANANKFIGFDANGDYAAKNAPSGGADKFVVTLTQENGTWTADKTIAQILEANAANKVVTCKIVYESDDVPHYEIPLSAAMDVAGIVVFGGVSLYERSVTVVASGIAAIGGDTWHIDQKEIPTSTPVIVTLTAGATEGQFVGDKTHKEAYDAFIAGQNVVFYAPAVNGMAEHVTAVENNTSAANPYVISTKSFNSSGIAGDVITITVGS